MPTPCELCGDLVYGRTVHPCCEFWRDVIEAGGRCPACAESRTAAKRAAGRKWMNDKAIREGDYRRLGRER